jgi:hypothetical protein
MYHERDYLTGLQLVAQLGSPFAELALLTMIARLSSLPGASALHAEAR